MNRGRGRPASDGRRRAPSYLICAPPRPASSPPGLPLLTTPPDRWGPRRSFPLGPNPRATTTHIHATSQSLRLPGWPPPPSACPQFQPQAPRPLLCWTIPDGPAGDAVHASPGVRSSPKLNQRRGCAPRAVLEPQKAEPPPPWVVFVASHLWDLTWQLVNIYGLNPACLPAALRVARV